MKNVSYCKGCVLYHQCNVKILNLELACPCIECLVKVTCNKSCQSFLMFSYYCSAIQHTK
jgi:hypothetical protein